MPTSDDRELMEAAKAGDMSAFSALVRRHQQRIYRLTFQMLRHPVEAEDVTQDTFVQAYRALYQFDARSQPYTWLYRIAVNLSLNRIRSRKRNQNAAALDDPAVDVAVSERALPHHQPDVTAANQQLYLAVCDGIDGLTETLRTTLILVSIEGLSHAEVSAVLGCPEGTVAWRVHEARKQLRAFLVERGHIDRGGK